MKKQDKQMYIYLSMYAVIILYSLFSIIVTVPMEREEKIELLSNMANACWTVEYNIRKSRNQEQNKTTT